MHILQEKLLDLASKKSLSNLSLREIGFGVGEKHPQKIKHHLEQLIKRGLLKFNKARGVFEKVKVESVEEGGLVSIPVLGSADCGPATIFANENVEGYLKVSKRIVKSKKGLFAIKAMGDSMNRSRINGKSLEDGDYAIVDSTKRIPINGDYIVSIIDDVANIKKYREDNKNKQIVLMSESTADYSAIYIHQGDVRYLVSGKVIDVIKNPNH